jgi:soluble lytic murein transglycosylase-like protein
MEIPTQQIMARIDAIQQRIDSLEGTAPAVPIMPPASDTGATPDAPPASFAAALANAANPGAQAAPLIGPDGTPVRPLNPLAGNVSDDVDAAASKYGIDPKLVQAVIQVESGGNPQAVSRAGAMGLMQLMPANVQEEGVGDPFDPAQNIDAGAKQLSGLLGEFGGNLDLALAAYNAGPNAVKRYGGIPPYPETQDYVRKIKSILDR